MGTCEFFMGLMGAFGNFVGFCGNLKDPMGTL